MTQLIRKHPCLSSALLRRLLVPLQQHRLSRFRLPHQKHQQQQQPSVPFRSAQQRLVIDELESRFRQGAASLPPSLITRPLIVDPVASDELIQQSALFKNETLGFHRLSFALQKYPALVLTFIAAWVLWGRGFDEARHGNEQSASIAALFVGAFTLGSILLCSLDHNCSCLTAKIMTNVRHACVFVSTLAAILVTVLAASTLQPLKDERDKRLLVTSTARAIEFSFADRINNQAILIGCSVLLVLFGLVTIVCGVIGLLLANKKLARERRRASRHMHGHDNPGLVQY